MSSTSNSLPHHKMISKAAAFVLGAISINPEHFRNENPAISYQPVGRSTFIPKPTSHARIVVPEHESAPYIPPMSSSSTLLNEQEIDTYRTVFNANTFFGFLHYDKRHTSGDVKILPTEEKGIIDCVSLSNKLPVGKDPVVYGGKRVFLGHNAEFLRSNPGIYTKQVVKKAVSFEIYSNRGCTPKLFLQYTNNAWEEVKELAFSDTHSAIRSQDIMDFRDGVQERRKTIAVVEFNQPKAEQRKSYGGLAAFQRVEEEVEYGSLRIAAIDLLEKNENGELCEFTFNSASLLVRLNKNIQAQQMLRSEKDVCPPHSLMFPGYGLEGLEL